MNNRSNVYQIFTPIFSVPKMEQENYISFIVFYNLLPHPISPAGPSSNIILLHWGSPNILSSHFTHYSLTLTNSFWETCSCLFLCLLFDNLEPEIRSFFLSFLKPANFPRQTQRQKLLLFTQRAIVVEPRNKSVENFPQKIKSKKLYLVVPLPYSNLTLREKKRRKTSPSSNDIVTQYFVTL